MSSLVRPLRIALNAAGMQVAAINGYRFSLGCIEVKGRE